MTHHAGYVEIHCGDALLLRAALRALREHSHHGRERLNTLQLERLSLILARVESVEDEYHANRERPRMPSDIWGVAI